MSQHFYWFSFRCCASSAHFWPPIRRRPLNAGQLLCDLTQHGQPHTDATDTDWTRQLTYFKTQQTIMSSHSRDVWSTSIHICWIPRREQSWFFSSLSNSNSLIINSAEAGYNVTQDCWFVGFLFLFCQFDECPELQATKENQQNQGFKNRTNFQDKLIIFELSKIIVIKSLPNYKMFQNTKIKKLVKKLTMWKSLRSASITAPCSSYCWV